MIDAAFDAAPPPTSDGPRARVGYARKRAADQPLFPTAATDASAPVGIAAWRV